MYRKLGPLAQSVEQRTFNPWVVGSIPTGPTQAIQGYFRANVRFVPKTLQIDSQFVVVDRGGDGRLLKDKTG